MVARPFPAEPVGDEVLIITNGGGIGVRTTDECEQMGLKLIDDAPWLEEQFRPTMPGFGSTKNPIDITGQSGLRGYHLSTHIALTQDRVNAVLLLYCETLVANPMDIAKMIHEEYTAVNRNKPLVVAMVGGSRTREAIAYLNEHSVPSFDAVVKRYRRSRLFIIGRNIPGGPKAFPPLNRSQGKPSRLLTGSRVKTGP